MSDEPTCDYPWHETTIEELRERVAKLETGLRDALDRGDFCGCHWICSCGVEDFKKQMDAVLADGRFTCGACGKRHHTLESLAPDCLAAFKPMTDEEIEAALERGRRERAVAEGT